MISELFKYFLPKNNEFRAYSNISPPQAGFLIFDKTGIFFHEDFTLLKQQTLFIPANELSLIDWQDRHTTNERLTLSRFLILGTWSILMPKRTFGVQTEISIETVNGDYYSFLIENLSTS